MKRMKTALFGYAIVFLQMSASADPALGYVIGWGSNGAGQTTGTPSISFSNGAFVATGNSWATGAVVIAGQVLSNAVAISAGFSHSLALRNDGTVVGWGGNASGAAVGYETPYPYRTNGPVVLNGDVLRNVIAITSTRDSSLALKSDGMIVAWGANYVPSGMTNITAIAGDFGAVWVLRRNGTVGGWRSQPAVPSSDQVLAIESLSNIVAISVGPSIHGTRGVALEHDGTVECWGGESIHMDASPPVDLSNVVAVAAGAAHSIALKNDGTVVGWGWNEFGEATGIATTNAPDLNYVCAGQVQVEGQVLSNIVAIAAGHNYSLALKQDGVVIAWGRMGDSRFPATVPEGLNNVVAIAAGAENFCLAITTNAEVAARFMPKEE